MDKRVTPPKRVASPTCRPQRPCKQALSYLRRAVFIFAPDEPSTLLLDTLSKSSTLPWKIDNKPLPGVFLEAFLLLQ